MRGAYILAIFLSTYLIWGLEPTVYDYIDIGSDRMATLQKVCDIYSSGTPFDSLSIETKQFLEDNDELFGESPYMTLGPGCSWYCGGGPFRIDYPNSHPEPENDSIKWFVHDADLRSAFVTVANSSEVEFLFDMDPVFGITDIDVYNGFCRDTLTWKKYSRAKSLQMSINDRIADTLFLQDTYLCQSFKIDTLSCTAGDTLSLRFTILNYYMGNTDSIAISEINFDGVGGH